jgi:hypothetical protein
MIFSILGKVDSPPWEEKRKNKMTNKERGVIVFHNFVKIYNSSDNDSLELV